ncbi:MAG: response regulator [Thermoanaerobaculia bacterium]
MLRLRDLPLQRKLTLILVLTSGVVFLLGSLGYFFYDVVTFRRMMRDDISLLGRTLEVNASTALVYNDRQTAELILGGLRAHPHILASCLLRPDGTLFAQQVRADLLSTFAVPKAPAGANLDQAVFEGNKLLLWRTVSFSGKPVGTLYLESDTKEIRTRIRDYGIFLGLVLLAGFLVTLALSSVLQKVISGPILRLVEVERRVSENKEYGLRAVKESNDEIGLLIDTFNEMLEQIHARDKELQVAKEKAEEASQAKSGFLANMSHELRTPLNAILGFAEIMIESAEEQGLTEFVEDNSKIQSAGKHLLGLINEILDLSKIEAGKMTVFLESIHLAMTLEETLGTVRPVVERAGNQLVIEYPPNLGTMRTDAKMLRQVLLNLISNASKFTENGKVTVSARRETRGGEWIVVDITDTGIGMTEEQISRLFQAFSQADASTTRRYGGTGLGLVLSKRFAQMLGGDVTVKSEFGKGSTFTLRLPAQSAEAGGPSSGQMRPPGRHRSGVILPVKLNNALGVPALPLALVIDDDPDVRDILATLLQKEGFRVALASSGEEGLRLARELMPAVITLDVMMPAMDGWTVLRMLKLDPTLSDIPVVMLTIVDDKQAGYALGASDYLLKPIERKRLASVVARFRNGDDPLALIVEDDVATRTLLQQALVRDGWRVREAGNGQAALDELAKVRPSVILLDLMLPVLDGFGFLAEFRKKEGWQSIPIVVMTSMDLSGEELRMLHGGVQDIVQKGASSMAALCQEIRDVARVHKEGPGAAAANR